MADAMQAAGQLNPLRDGIVHREFLPAADSRARALELIRCRGPVASDLPDQSRFRRLLRPFFSVRGFSRLVPMVHVLAPPGGGLA